RPDDALAGGAERIQRGVRLDRADRLREQRLNLEVLPDAVDRARGVRARRAVEPRQRLDRAAIEHAEEVLLAERALLLVDALTALSLQDLRQERLGLRPGPGAAARIGEVQVDDDVVDLL